MTGTENCGAVDETMLAVRAEWDERGGGCNLRLVGDVDLSTASELERRFTSLIAAGTRLILVDLSDVKFIDSSGLRVLARASRAMEARDGALFIQGARGATLRVLEVCGLLDGIGSPTG
jgi:anti-sigma B factor antagonist